jgi:hypothetical protein
VARAFLRAKHNGNQEKLRNILNYEPWSPANVPFQVSRSAALLSNNEYV